MSTLLVNAPSARQDSTRIQAAHSTPRATTALQDATSRTLQRKRPSTTSTTIASRAWTAPDQTRARGSANNAQPVTGPFRAIRKRPQHARCATTAHFSRTAANLPARHASRVSSQRTVANRKCTALNAIRAALRAAKGPTIATSVNLVSGRWARIQAASSARRGTMWTASGLRPASLVSPENTNRIRESSNAHRAKRASINQIPAARAAPIVAWGSMPRTRGTRFAYDVCPASRRTWRGLPNAKTARKTTKRTFLGWKRAKDAPRRGQ